MVLVAEEWLLPMEKVLNALAIFCVAEDEISKIYLHSDAGNRKRSVKQMCRVTGTLWRDFSIIFFKHHFSQAEREKFAKHIEQVRISAFKYFQNV